MPEALQGAGGVTASLGLGTADPSTRKMDHNLDKAEWVTAKQYN